MVILSSGVLKVYYLRLVLSFSGLCYFLLRISGILKVYQVPGTSLIGLGEFSGLYLFLMRPFLPIGKRASS